MLYFEASYLSDDMDLQIHLMEKGETNRWREISFLHQSAQEKKSHLTSSVFYLVSYVII